MIIKIGDVEIHGYDPSNKEQRHLKYTFDQDEIFRKYVTKKINERLLESIIPPGGGLQFHHSYLIKYKDEYVGYIRLEEKESRVGILDIQCAVSKEFRNQKLGSRLLKTVSDYILENYQEVTKLRGVIERNNYVSRSMAQSAGFIKDSQDEEYIYVSKGR